MEWDLKIPPWDLAELERDVRLSIGSMAGSSGGLDHLVRGQDCSVDLKLGGLGDLGLSGKWKEQPRALTTMVMSSATLKRARASSNGTQTVSCLVQGCTSDLSKSREYHRRHKVCEVHSKTAIVMVGGREQRFCQQCSRFHLLIEFDKVKRSCRKRLDGHNRRRRKPQPEYITTASLISNQQGTIFSSYPQICPAAAPEHNGTLYTRRPTLQLIDRQQCFLSSFDSYNEGEQFPLLWDSDAALNNSRTLGTSSYHADHRTFAPFESSSSSKMFKDGITQVLNSNRSHSLLSTPSQTSGIDLSRIIPGDRIPMGQPLVSGLQYGGLGRYSRPQASNTVSPTGFSCLGAEDRQVGTGFVPHSGDADLRCQGSSDGNSEALPFSWE